VANERRIHGARENDGKRIANPHGARAFDAVLREPDIAHAHSTIEGLWGETATVLDPMAGGGSIPLEAARLGLDVLANEYNPVACTILEATVDYPLRYSARLDLAAKRWASVWHERFVQRMAKFYAAAGLVPAFTYLFARTVPCPDTGHPTPLVPDWSL